MDAITETENFAAVKFKEGETRSISKYYKLGHKLDDIITQVLTQEVNKMFATKWTKYSTTKKKNKNIEDFIATLSTKQLPTGAVSSTRERVEGLIKANMIDGVMAEELPEPESWLNNKVRDLKKSGDISVIGLINDYTDILKAEQNIENQDPIGN